MPHAAFPFVAIHPLWGIAPAAFTFRPLLTNSAIQHCLIVSWSVSYGGERRLFLWSETMGDGKRGGSAFPWRWGTRLVSSLLSHWLCRNQWQAHPWQQCWRPAHHVTQEPCSEPLHELKRQKPNITRGGVALFHFSMYLSLWIVTFAWMTTLNFLQPQTFCAWPHCLVTLLRLFPHFCAILPIAPTLPTPKSPPWYILCSYPHTTSNQD